MSPAPSCGNGPRDTPGRAPGVWTPLHGTFVMGSMRHPEERVESSLPASPAREMPVEWQPQLPAQPQPPMAPAYVPMPQHLARPLKEEVARAMRQAAHVHGQWSFFLSDIEGMLQRLVPTTYQRELLGEVVRLLVEEGEGSLGEGNATFHLERQPQSPPRPIVAPPGFRGGSTSSAPAKKAMLLVDGGYYEAIQWGVLDKFGTGYVVDVRRLVRRLEEIYDAQFVRRHYVQGTENGTLSSFHKMLTSPENKGPGFTVDIHKMKEQSIRRGVAMSSASDFGKASVMVEQGVDVAIAMEILRSTMKASYESLVVITGDANLEPAFRVATEENRERELLKEKVQELYVLGGQKMSHELFAYTRGVRGSPVVFLETIMKECVVKKEELEKSLLSCGDLASLACLPVPEPRPSKPLSRGITPVSSWSDMRSLARSSASDTGSEEGNCGRGVTVRWCSYGATCKFLACPDENLAHFKKYGHMCPDDQSCPFMLDYATHRRSEKGKVHFGLWRHSCPKGANCNFVEHPELHKKHMEKFTHDCYDECPPTPASMAATPTHAHPQASLMKAQSNTMSPTSRLAHLWAAPVDVREDPEEDCGMPLVLLKDFANLLLDGEGHEHQPQEPFMMGGGAPPMMGHAMGGGAAVPRHHAMRGFPGVPMMLPNKEHQLVFTQAA